MALTLANESNQYFGNLRAYVAAITFDSSYATGGEALTAPFGTVLCALAEQSGGYSFEYDTTNQKLKAYYADNNNASDGPLIEVPNATNLSAITTHVLFLGV